MPTAKKGRSSGRPTVYSEKIGQAICARLAEGESLRSVCAAEDMPDERAVRKWVSDPLHPISPQYAQAREAGYLKLAEELVEIADDGSNDWMERNYGDDKPAGWLANGEHVQRSRLRIDTRKWLLSKMLPKVFGDKVVNEHVGKDGGKIEVEFVAASNKD